MSEQKLSKTENDLVNGMEKYLSQYFIVTREVWDITHKNRIDVLLQLKENTDVCFGIEVKIDGEKRGNELGKHVLQAMRYSNCSFRIAKDDYRKIPILIYPPLSCNYFVLNNISFKQDNKTHYIDRHEPDNEHHSFNGFIGAFGIGELRYKKVIYKETKSVYYYISFNNKVIWSNESRGIYENGIFVRREMIGLHEVNYNFLINKLC